jgi:hypothetical protein
MRGSSYPRLESTGSGFDGVVVLTVMPSVLGLDLPEVPPYIVGLLRRQIPSRVVGRKLAVLSAQVCPDGLLVPV